MFDVKVNYSYKQRGRESIASTSIVLYNVKDTEDDTLIAEIEKQRPNHEVVKILKKEII